ncbi:cytochrome P450 9b2-like isoform X1 [Teleopsis dalmanni]|uniref:cytochrome P450 9b2-like isoform X1 n=1 Tax=Teleopsis dalmanni TaxID=139649 RepID=UPI0018CC8B1D|nr:cytochrome P450 9b2-like isoform X1 [Teleopsis dalmanni]
MFIYLVLLLILYTAYLLNGWLKKTFTVFENRGVPHKKPVPFIGNALDFLKGKESLHKIMIRLYRQTKQHKIYGYYNFSQAFFIVNDPELIIKLGVKDSDTFANHQRLFNADKDPLFSGMLTVMRDQRWKNMRNTLTPVFTASKMRAMFTLMNDCFAESIKYLHKRLDGGNSVDINMKECFSRLSNDLIATTAFGLKVNSFIDENNEFYTIGSSITKTKGLQALKFMLYSLSPKLFDLLGLKPFDKKRADYFVNLVSNAMKYREENNIHRPDMIQLMMEVKKDSPYNWSHEEIVAQCFIFFFAAFENNASFICTTCHELMNNPDVQAKLYEEIMEFDKKLNGETLSYDTLKDMKYLNMVVSESLRKWTLAALTDRECSSDYDVTDDEGNLICKLKQGDRIWFQIVGIHWDDEYYPNPETFDPERFNDENKANMKSMTYLPFGVGPRICIGNRYALMQAKAMIYYLLKEFKLERSEKTCNNLLDDLRGFQVSPKSGFWLKLVQRTK